MIETGPSRKTSPWRRSMAWQARAVGVGLLLHVSCVAVAQQAVIDHCRKTSTDADRIACLEAALIDRGRGAAKPAPAAQIDPPSLTLDAGPAAADVDTQDDAATIGQQQVDVRNETRDERLANLEQARGLAVAGYGEVPYQRLLIRLENGQEWLQIKGDTQHIQADLRRNQTVDITESSLGGYKLKLNEMRRTIRVERIR